MSTLKPLNDQPVELTLSFESVLKVNLALEAVTAQAVKYRNMCKDNLACGLDAANVYVNESLLKTMNSEITYLTDLKRVITCMLDNVADKYADELVQNDKEMQAAMRAAPSTVSEKAVDCIINEMARRKQAELNEKFELQCEDDNKAKCASITTNL